MVGGDVCILLIYFLKTKSLLVGLLVMGVSWVGAETGSVLVLQIFSRGKAALTAGRDTWTIKTTKQKNLI